ncbi:MBL fold metallo-hydrolase [Limnothrix sp. FACHB-881]|uniref:MBL fold metallo-hydrolase n=1 Tax=Limnothrix sp. FACHB-881 TaxID=2692819 RepID=UPI00351C5BE5
MTELECLPYAVGHGGEGMCLVVRLGTHRVMLDCGLRSLSPLLGEAWDHPNPIRPRSGMVGWGRMPADWVVCSHAHRDHARGLLKLHEQFPHLPIFASGETAQLLPTNWLDRPLESIPLFCQSLPWRSPVALADDLTVELLPAGHLPGAALTLLRYQSRAESRSNRSREYCVAYSGDFFLSNGRLVEGMPLTEVRGLAPDVLIVEGSYGVARRSRRRRQENDLADQVSQALAQGRSVLLPVPLLGLGQELLMLLRSHHYFTGREFTIWVDRQVAAGCDAYLAILDRLPESVQNFARHQNLFWDDRVRPLVRRLSSDQNGPDLALEGPCLLLVDDDLPVAQLCDRFCQTGRWLVSVQAAAGGRLEAEPLRSPHEGDRILYSTYELSEHSDGLGTLQLIHNMRPQHVVFVHGGIDHLSGLAALDELNSRYQIHCPSAGAALELPIGESFAQPAAPIERYEGEISTGEGAATVHLPDAIVHSPRWKAFAETGLVEVRWQGSDLVLRGMSPREVLDRNTAWPDTPDLICCQTCQFYRGQHCRNPASPLADRRVAPDGCCPVYASNSDRQPT